ncbi:MULTISPECIES: helix-turn-helix domain-containing protein [unclassified Streptomyces]|uniref:helix-turn-helix domain-containing protein n=1 Tax=unclassified Streptomyces TaxID=2593676 RepID=UPI00278BF6C1|nr:MULTISPECIES: helix-turn-helix domain-containing protein [unclassified Streptomyces]
MDTQHPSAPARAESRTAGNGHPTSGVIHENIRLTSRFTVIGNDLAQHRGLSFTAIGISVHIQSLPAGSLVDIRTLAAQSDDEGRDRIAAALDQLETHGFLRRERHRLPGGRIATRTVSCNRPGHRRAAAAPAATEPDHPAREQHPPKPSEPSKSPEPSKPPQPSKPPKPLAVPHPASASPALLQQATDLLTTLHRREPVLLLSAEDTARLAPGVATWLEREATPTAVRLALTSNLPQPLRRPAALLAHRLTALLPPPPPIPAPSTAPPVRHPLRNCDTCDHAYRGPEPGECPACKAAGQVPDSPGAAAPRPAASTER